MSADRILGDSRAIANLRDQLQHLAAFDTVGNPYVPTTLIQGETGSGKGLVARVMHASGARAGGPFIEVNCAAIPEHLLEAELYGFEPGAFTDARRGKPGLFEVASGGTLFLDEIESLPMALQGKLLRAIEDKRVRRLAAVADVAVDVKIVAAAQQPLRDRVTGGTFRPDLYHRLAVVVVDIPPLRERREDVLPIAQHFLRVYADAHGVTARRLDDTAEAWLARYDWPGNVRELGHLMERLTLLAPDATIGSETLERLGLASRSPSWSSDPSAAVRVGNGDEAAQIRDAIERSRGNVVQAARALGISRNALRYRMLRYGIERAAQRPAASGGGRPADIAESRAVVSPGPERATPVWERKPIVALAIDLTFPKHLGIDPSLHQPWTVMTRWEDMIAEKVCGFGGMLLERTPSLFTVVFGVPHALDRMPERAVHAALAVRHLVEQVDMAADPRPEIRVGVHLGEALVDVSRPGRAGQLLAIGDALALPVRLLGLVGAGEIMVSAAVQRVVEREFKVTARALPAESGSVTTPMGWVVNGLVGTRVGRRTTFVGRQRELADLGRAFEVVKQGRGQVVAIVGDAGVGKSRLTEEFLDGVRDGCLVLELSGVPGPPSAFLPVVDLLKRYCALDGHDDPRARRQKVVDRILALDEQLGETVPYVLALLGVSDPGSALPHMDSEPRRQRTLDAVKAILLRESTNRPVVLVAEDVHWFDSETLAFLEILIDSITGARLLLLATFRTGHPHPWSGKSCFAQLRLDPLMPAEADDMATALVGGATDVKRLVLDKAQGNPFFIEELVHVVRGRAATDFELPLTIQGVLGARMDRLDVDERELLQTVAVLGHEFPLPVVQRVTGRNADDLRAMLDRLQAAEFIHARPAWSTPTYAFKHALTREVAYGTIDREQRLRLHRVAVEAIELVFADRLEDHYHALAQHAHRAGLAVKAVDYLGHAGRQAVQRSAYVEAIAHFEQALNLLSMLPPGRERNQQELTIQTALGAALMATRGLGAPEVEVVFTKARELCRAVGETAQLFQVLQGLSVFYALRVKLRMSEELAEERRRLAERLGHPALALQAQIARGHVLLALGELPTARAELERAAGLYDPQQHHALAFGGVDPSGRDHAAVVLWLLGYPDKAMASLQQMMAIAHERPHPFTLTVAQLFAAMLHQLRREPERVREWADAAMAVTTDHAFAMWRAMALLMHGWAVAVLGDAAEGVARLRRGLDDWRATGAELLRPYFLGLLAERLGAAGRGDEGLAVLDEAIETTARTEQRWCEAELVRLRGVLLLTASRQVDAAEDSLRVALAIARRQQAKSFELRTATSLAHLLCARSEGQQARRVLSDVHGWFTEGFDTPDLRDARSLLDTVRTAE